MPAKTQKKAPAKKTARYSYREDDPKIRGGAEMYGSARAKLRKARGRASEHKCKCGEPATAWVFTPKKGAEIWLDPTGLRFSKDPADYTAMCGQHAREYQKKQRAKAARK